MARRGLVVGVYLPLFLFLQLASGHRGMLLGGKRRADIGTDSSDSIDTASAYATWTPTSPALNVFGFVRGRIGIRNEIPAFDSAAVEVDNQTPGFDRRAGQLAGGRKVGKDDDAIARLFSRQATCPTGFSPCSDNRNLCCPTGGSCCSDGTCCASGLSCVFQTSPSKIVCCPNGANCPGTSPCQDPGYVICQGQNFCCPSGWTCFRDSLGVGKCNPPTTTTSGSTGSSSATGTQTGTDTSLTSTASTTQTTSASSSTTASLTSTTQTTPRTTPTTPITTPTVATNGGVSFTTTSTTVAVGPPTAESQNLTSNTTPAGAIAGGVVGGVALIALIIVAIVIIVKKRRAAEEAEVLPSPTLPMDFAPQMAQFQEEQAMYATSMASGGGGGGGGAGYATSVASGNTAGVAGYGAGGYNPGGFAAPAAAAAAGAGAYHYQKRTSYPNPNQAYGGYDDGAYGTSPEHQSDPFRTPPPRGPYFSNAPHLGSYGALPADQRYSGVSQDRRYSQTQRYSAQGQSAAVPPQSASTNEHSSYSHYNGPSVANTASFYGGDSPTRAQSGQFGQAR